MITIGFGNDPISFELQPGDSLTEKEPNDKEFSWNPESFPEIIGRAGFSEIIGKGKIVFVVNDSFRPTPTGDVLCQIRNIYPDLRADFIVACGNHPPPTEDDLKAIFGSYQVPDKSELFFHDSRATDSLTAVGKLKGQTLYLNRKLFEYPAIIIIGSVEPHYFAGFTGGRKSIVPGLADLDSNRRNHALAVSEKARPLKLKGNPVAEQLEELLELAKLPSVFSIQLVTGRDRNIIGCFCGNLKDSFEEAVGMAEQVYAFRNDKKYDLVIAEMCPPLDRNLYQLQKGIENCAAAVKTGGTIMAVSACVEGIGNTEFYQLAGRLKDEEMVFSHAEMDNQPMGIHKLTRIINMSRRISVKALTGLKHEILRQVFIEPAVSIEAEIQKLKKADKQEIDILLVRDAGLLAVK